MKEFVCIVCPRGCNLLVDDNGNVSGNFCPRGKSYAIEEMTNPKRTITTSIRVINREDTLVSIKTSCGVPKEKIFEVMNVINSIKIEAPTRIGQVALKDILNTGADIVVTKNID